MYSLKSCEKCGKEHRNPKYCSLSCAASANNRIFPKGKNKPKSESRNRIKRVCKWCNVFLGDGYHGSRTCVSCNKNIVDWSKVTVAEFKERCKGLRFHARIRSLARQEFKRSNQQLVCKKCNRERGTQVCHINPVSNFGSSSTIADINAITNLIALCPNHHWDLDHGFLELENL